MIFQNSKGISPVKQDFIWVGEYYDGTYISEFDFNTKKENSFYAINKDKLIRFGLIGQGMKLYFEVFNGIFKLDGHSIEVIYHFNNKDYYLTGQNLMYNDIICYKNAESIANLSLNNNKFVNTITQYNFGYKIKYQIDDIYFQFQAICSIPYNDYAYIQFKINADQDLNGKLIIKRNNRVIDELLAPLKAGNSGILNWTIK